MFTFMAVMGIMALYENFSIQKECACIKERIFMKKQKKLTVLLMLIVMVITTLLPVTTAGAASYTEEEILLARVIQMEGGTDTESREAIASVVINRLNNPAWNDDTISEVIYHKNQFSVVNSSKFKTLEPKEANLTVARRIIKNGATVPGIEYFKSGSSSKGTLKNGLYYWGNHPYYKTIKGNHFYFTNKAAYDKYIASGGSTSVAEHISTKNHTVVKGDTLSRLAKKYKTTISVIKKLNPSIRGTLLVLGTKIDVPTEATTSLYGSSSKKLTTVPGQVKRGDTLNKLAKKYNTTVSQIKAKNKLKSSLIRIGQKLKVVKNSK